MEKSIPPSCRDLLHQEVIAVFGAPGFAEYRNLCPFSMDMTGLDGEYVSCPCLRFWRCVLPQF